VKYWSGEGTLHGGPGHGETVRTTVNLDGVSVVRNGAVLFHPARDVHASADPAGTARLRFTREPDLELYLDDPAALACLRRNGYLRVFPFGIRPHVRNALLAVLAAAALAFLFLTTGLDMLADAAVRALPPAVEARIGAAAYAAVEETVATPDSAVAEVLRACAAAMGGFAEAERWDIRLSLVEDTAQVNAFALPGGRVVVYRGMLDAAMTQEELFGVLAHETGHVALRHGLRGMARSAAAGVAMALLFGDAGGVAGLLLENSAGLLQLSYSREQEREADRWAVEALRRAGIHPGGLATLFRRMAEREGMPRWMAFLSTHPGLGERAAEIAAWTAGDGGGRRVLTGEQWRLLTGRREDPAR